MPENTIPAFLKAVDLGVTTLELDVVISGDNQVVVSHEAFLNPEICSNPSGENLKKDTVYNLYQMPYSVIAKCDCGSKGHPRFAGQQKMTVAKPTLAAVIDAVKAHCAATGKPLPKFNVEIKSDSKTVFLYHPPIAQFCELVLAVLQQNLLENSYNIQSFDVLTLQYLHAKYPNITLAFLVEEDTELTEYQLSQQLDLLGFTPNIYSCNFQILNDKSVAILQQKGMRVIPWTVNEVADMQNLINMGVDGIITDYPDRLLDLLTK